MTRPARRGFTYTDLLVILVLILLLIPVVFVLMPSRRRGDTAVRVKCMSNLKQIGIAMLLYSNENRNHYPRARHAPGHDAKPTWGTGTT